MEELPQDKQNKRKVIDCAVTPPFKEFFINPDYMKDYFRVYGTELEEGLEALLNHDWSAESFIQMLDNEGIDIAVVRARVQRTAARYGYDRFYVAD